MVALIGCEVWVLFVEFVGLEGVQVVGAEEQVGAALVKEDGGAVSWLQLPRGLLWALVWWRFVNFDIAVVLDFILMALRIRPLSLLFV